jgi:hypothetical protein
MKLKQTLIEAAGWYGAVAILAAYALVSFSLISPTSISSQLLNVTGAIGIVITAASKKDYAPVVLNVVWAVIAIVILIGRIR